VKKIPENGGEYSDSRDDKGSKNTRKSKRSEDPALAGLKVEAK